MPRAIDPSLPAGGLPITHDPLNTIQYNVIPNPVDLAELLQMIIDGFAESIQNYLFPAIEQLTGIDLSALLPLLQTLDLDFSTPTAFLQSLIDVIVALPGIVVTLLTSLIQQLLEPGNSDIMGDLLSGIIELLLSLPGMLFDLATGLIGSGAGLLGGDSPLDSLNLFNIIPDWLLGMLDFSSIGETISNLIVDPLFEIAESFFELLDWDHDPAPAHAGNGAAMTTADGTTHELLSNLIPASLGQVFDLSGWVKWTGLTGSGNPIALAVTGYDTAGTAVSQESVDTRGVTPGTTDWLNMSGTYTVPAGVTGVRTRLVVGSGATAGTVWFDDMSATKTQNVFQRLIAGTDPGDNLTDDISNLFGGIITNALGLLEKASQGDFEGLISTILGDVQEGFEDIGDLIGSFLNGESPLNGDNIFGEILDEFIPGIGDLHDIVVTAVGNLTGGGFDLTKVFEVLTGQTNALVGHGAGLSDVAARMSNLESQFAALPVSAGGTGSGNADGGLVGAIDTDTFERTSSSSLGALWLQSYSGGAGVWATPNGHDATFDTSGWDTREFLCIRNNSAVPRSQTDYQRVTMELSSKATRDRDLLGLYDYCGTNDIWLRISDATTSLANITGIRIRWEGDGALSIHRFVSGAGVQLAGLGTGGITPPGPGGQLIGEAGVLADGAVRYFRALVGGTIRLQVQEVGTASGLGAAHRRWGHGGRAQGASLLVGQTKPGGVHFWNGMDQTTS